MTPRCVTSHGLIRATWCLRCFLDISQTKIHIQTFYLLSPYLGGPGHTCHGWGTTQVRQAVPSVPKKEVRIVGHKLIRKVVVTQIAVWCGAAAPARLGVQGTHWLPLSSYGRSGSRKSAGVLLPRTNQFPDKILVKCLRFVVFQPRKLPQAGKTVECERHREPIYCTHFITILWRFHTMSCDKDS